MKKILSRCRSVQSARSNPRHSICVVLENIRSLHNVGAVFRTADAASIEKLFLCGITGSPPAPDIAKTALGAQMSVPWEYHKSSIEVVSMLREEGFQIFAVEQTDESVWFWNMSYPEKVALVFGYEIEGISNEVLQLCDGSIEIPMLGYKGSLNISVACGIVLFDVLGKRMNIR